MNRPQVAYFLSGPLVYFPSGARRPWPVRPRATGHHGLQDTLLPGYSTTWLWVR